MSDIVAELERRLRSLERPGVTVGLSGKRTVRVDAERMGGPGAVGRRMTIREEKNMGSTNETFRLEVLAESFEYDGRGNPRSRNGLGVEGGYPSRATVDDVVECAVMKVEKMFAPGAGEPVAKAEQP